MSDLKTDVEAFFSDGMREVQRRLTELGENAVRRNVEEGDYRNRTGHLRGSKYYEVTTDGLTLGNRAEYASAVESKGFNVIDSGVKYLMEELNDNDIKSR